MYRQPTKHSTTLYRQTPLSNEEATIYGNRFPNKFQKLCLLGKGGCAIVWKGTINAKLYAIKQISKKGSTADSNIASVRNEYGVYKQLESIANKLKHTGINYICKVHEIIEDKYDIWHVADIGGASLGKLLFEIKGEFIKSERVYNIKHLPFHQKLTQDPIILKKFIIGMLTALDLFKEAGIIHGDLKPENILIAQHGNEIDVKIIDFGSSITLSKSTCIKMSTPEYLSPEALAFCDSPHHNSEQLFNAFCKTMHPWSCDMWSVGAILLEIFIGLPLWLSLKGKICNGNKTLYSKGLFAVTGRSNSKIIKLQLLAVSHLDEIIKEYNVCIDPALLKLMHRMLEIDPLKRISPKEALEHDFLKC